MSVIHETPDGVTRRLRRAARSAFNRFGYTVERIPEPVRGQEGFPPDFEDRDVDIYQAVQPYTMTSPEAVFGLCSAVRYVVASEIPGAIVECGVWKGGSMMAVAKTLLELGVRDRMLYLFDTFDGMTEPTDLDVVSANGVTARDALAAASRDAHIWARAPLEGVERAMRSTGYDPSMVRYVRGPVEETLPDDAPDPIALLRIDTDWYESTRHELVHLYPRLSRGGVVIVDDYGAFEGARKATDEYLRENGLRVLLNRVDNTVRLVIKPD
jgi:hypothetical protein